MQVVEGIRIRVILAAALAGIGIPIHLRAQNAPENKVQSAALFSSIRDAAQLYEKRDNPYIQPFALVGRHHGQ